MEHRRQSRPDFALGFKAKVLKTFRVVPILLGSGFGVRRTASRARGIARPTPGLRLGVQGSTTERPHENAVGSFLHVVF